MKYKIISKIFSKKGSPFLGYVVFFLIIVILVTSRISEKNIDETTFKYILIVCLSLLFIIYIYVYATKGTCEIKEIGYVIFNNSDCKITLKVNTDEYQYKISELKNINLVYRGYKGESISFLIPRFTSQSGIDNKLSFSILDKNYCYFIMIENKKASVYLKDIIKKNNGVIKQLGFLW
jgi:uncharacterized protein YlbG (UPF0298 family)